MHPLAFLPCSARARRFVVLVCLTGLALAPVAAADPAEVSLAGDWQIRVRVSGPAGIQESTLEVPRNVTLEVAAERHDSLPVFNPQAGGWVKGAQLRQVRAQETTTPFLLEGASLQLRTSDDPQAPPLRPDLDYSADLTWGTVGRLTNGSLAAGQTVFASYRYTPLRLDTVVRTSDGKILLRPGEPRAAAPLPPALRPGEHRLANVWLPGRLDRLTPANLFPILETAFPESAPTSPAATARVLPRTLERLQSGRRLRILAWGDSVTDGGYVPDPSRDRWQEQFVRRLRAAYPRARIELITEAWGGRNTAAYLAEPAGSPHHYPTQVLEPKPDLIVSEFVNDAGLNPAQVEERYGQLLADFRRLGAEWIILTPHYVRPDWMGMDRENEVDDDPRPYVAGLRQFAAKHDVALADAAMRYGRLWRQGIPHTTLMLNSINHPDARGMALFADALMALFPVTERSSGLRVTPRAESTTAAVEIRTPLLPDDILELGTCEGVLVGDRDLGLFQVKLGTRPGPAAAAWESTDGVLRYSWAFPPGVWVHFEGRPANDRFELHYRVENRTPDALERVQIHVCLPTTRAPSFFAPARPVADVGDPTPAPPHAELYDRLWLWAGSRAFPFSSSPLARTEPHLSFMRNGFLPIRWAWWVNAPETFDVPLLAAASRDGRHTLALEFEDALWASANVGDDRACFHLFPHFGNIPPGASRSVRGSVAVLVGTPTDARAWYDR